MATQVWVTCVWVLSGLCLFGGLVAFHLSVARNAIRKAQEQASRELEASKVLLQKQITDLENDKGALALRNEDLNSEYNKVKTEVEENKPIVERARCAERALDEMKKVWLENDSLEIKCRKLLCRHSWLLSPDYKVEGTLIEDNAVSNIIKQLFRDMDSQEAEKLYALIKGLQSRPDVAGWINTSGSIQPNIVDNRNHRALMLIERKRPSCIINRDVIQQTHRYAWEFVQHAPGQWDAWIECFIIGGSIEADLSDVNVRLGKSIHRTIRITPLTYQRLYDRAEKMIHCFEPVQTDQCIPVREAA
jgi:hypothetical protein